MSKNQIIHIQTERGEFLGFVEGNLDAVKFNIRQTFKRQGQQEPNFMVRHVGGRRYVLKVITGSKSFPIKPGRTKFEKLDMDYLLKNFPKTGKTPFPFILWDTPDYIRHKRGWRFEVFVNILKIKYPALISYGTASHVYTGEIIKWWKINVEGKPFVITEEGKDLPYDTVEFIKKDKTRRREMLEGAEQDNLIGHLICHT